MPSPVLRDTPLAGVDATALYGILQLRSLVFVVEQDCVFLEPDGLDLHPSCRLLWLEADGGAVLATARVIDEGETRRIGRIVTHPDARGKGHAGRLVEHFLATTDGPWVLDAQSALVDWYRGFGFEVSGDEYVEDGIPHRPMRRVTAASP